MTVADLQLEFLGRKPHGIAPEDFWPLLAEAAGKSKEFLLAHPDYPLTGDTEGVARVFFMRRLRHEPVAAILGRKEFYGRSFRVTKATLIPRPETELLVDAVIEAAQAGGQRGPFDIADIGTGSGAIIISVAGSLPQPGAGHRFFATDISPVALDTARQNAARFPEIPAILFLEGSLLDPLLPHLDPGRELIVAANLPYLSSELYASAPPDVRLYEPRSALWSGEEGLGHYRELLVGLTLIPRRPLSFFLEISPEQAPVLSRLIRERWPRASLRVIRDLSGRERVVAASLP